MPVRACACTSLPVILGRGNDVGEINKLDAREGADGAGGVLRRAGRPPAAAAPGDVYVTDRDAGPGGSGAVLRVDPATGAQTVIASGGDLADPTGIAVDLFAPGATDSLLVADPSALGGTGALFRVDPASGAVQVVSSGRHSSQTRPTSAGSRRSPIPTRHRPTRSATATSSASAQTGVQRSFLNTVTPLTQVPLADPVGTGRKRGRAAADRGPGGGRQRRRVRALTRRQDARLAFHGLLAGRLVLGPGRDGPRAQRDPRRGNDRRRRPNGSGRLRHRDARGGVQRRAAASSTGAGLLASPSDVAFTPFAGGPLLVADRAAAGGSGALVGVDPATGAQRIVSSGGVFAEPAGVVVSPPRLQRAPRRAISGPRELTRSTARARYASLGGNDMVGDVRRHGVRRRGRRRDEPGRARASNAVTLFGEDGNDRVTGGGGKDSLDGGPGEDVLRARRGKKDEARLRRGPRQGRRRHHGQGEELRAREALEA